MTEVIMMIHGMWAGGWCWENYKKFFEARGYHCITPTLRFHDVNPKEPSHPQLGTTSVSDYAQDLENEIKNLDMPPILMGHSMGGLLAQILGGRGLAKSLILLAPAAPHGIIALKPSVIRGFGSGLKKWGFWRKSMRQTFDEAAYSTMHLLTVQEQHGLFDRYVCESGRAACEIGFSFLDSKRATKVDESRVTCPVLVVAGTEDRITPASIIRKVADKYGAVSTYKEFANHAHWLLLEPGWQEITEYISDWLNNALSETNNKR